MDNKVVTLMIQKWGNSLAVRIPAKIARSAHFRLGSVVELDVYDGNILVKHSGKTQLSLEQRLAVFDINKHGSEEMATKLIGKEKI